MQPVERVTYRNVRVWDGAAANYAEADSVTVEGGRIVAVDDASSSAGNAASRDMAGLTALPGLIDAHVHMTLDPAIRMPDDQLAVSDDAIVSGIEERALAMAQAGITTARDLGGGKWLELAVRDRILADELPGPRLLCAGQPVTSVRGHCHFWGGEAVDAESAAAVIERQAEHGVDLIKVMATGGFLTKGSSQRDAQYDAETVAAIVRCARGHGYDVAAHCHATAGIDHAARAGVTTIEHCSWLGKEPAQDGYVQAIAERIVANGAWVSPTINSGWRRFIGGGQSEHRVVASFAKMRAAGVRLIASTDAGIPNVPHHDLPRALPVFAHLAALSPVQTLRTATSDCAAAIGLGSETGRLAPGFAADVLFVEGDPLADLSALASPALVLTRGREISPQGEKG